MNIKYMWAKCLKHLLNPPSIRFSTIDSKAKVCPRSELSHVKIGRYSYIGNQCFLVNVEIGQFCSIADRCVIGGASHRMDCVSTSPVFEARDNVLKTNFSDSMPLTTPKTFIGHDVWLGMGVYVKAGITIGIGAVVGMGSVVTKDIPPYEVWAGNPARKIRDRFDSEISHSLLAAQWWDWSEEQLRTRGKEFEDVQAFCLSL